MVEVDPYIPIAVRTYIAPIGAVFYRVGNFQTSLVEVPIEPMTGLIRGLKVVLIDHVGATLDAGKQTAIQGLPVVAPDAIPNRLHDDPREVAVALNQDQFIVDWSDGRRLDQKVELGRLTFFLGGGELIGAAVGSLTEDERGSLLVHLSKV